MRGHQGARRPRSRGARRRPGMDRPPRLLRSGRGGAAVARRTLCDPSRPRRDERDGRRAGPAPHARGATRSRSGARAACGRGRVISQRTRRPPRDRRVVGRSGDGSGPLPRCRRSARARRSRRRRSRVRAVRGAGRSGRSAAPREEHRLVRMVGRSARARLAVPRARDGTPDAGGRGDRGHDTHAAARAISRA